VKTPFGDLQQKKWAGGANNTFILGRPLTVTEGDSHPPFESAFLERRKEFFGKKGNKKGEGKKKLKRVTQESSILKNGY